MKAHQAIALFMLAAPVFALAQQKPKKHSDVSAVFMNARYVYVEAQAGDITRPGLYPDDRQAIADVQDGIEDWQRYRIVTRREEADLVFIVRKGRMVGEQNRVGLSGGPPRPQNPTTQNRQPGQGPGQDDDGFGVGAEVGPSDDMLRVYTTNPDGKLIGPVWNREMKDGLDGPTVVLLLQLRTAVEKAYPTQTPSQPAPKKP
jgi:hypothetical protein